MTIHIAFLIPANASLAAYIGVDYPIVSAGLQIFNGILQNGVIPFTLFYSKRTNTLITFSQKSKT